MPALQQPGSAREHATTSVPRARPEQTAGEIRTQLAGRSFDHAGDVAVLERDTLVGLLSLERLLAAAPEVRVADLMDTSPPVVHEGTGQEAVALEMARDQCSAAVVDADGRFVGLIPPHQMLGVLLTEHDEDLARLGGYLAKTQSARSAAEETVRRRLWHRLPWLLVGLAGAMAAALIVGGFEEELDKTVLLAFFLPAVVYMADAVGTQTETLLIRGIRPGSSCVTSWCASSRRA